MFHFLLFWPFILLGWLGWPGILAAAALGTYVVMRDEAKWQRLPKVTAFSSYLRAVGGRGAVITGYFLAMALTLSTCVAVLG